MDFPLAFALRKVNIAKNVFCTFRSHFPWYFDQGLISFSGDFVRESVPVSSPGLEASAGPCLGYLGGSKETGN